MKKEDAEVLRQKLDSLDARQVDTAFDPDGLWNAIQQQLPAPKTRRTVSLPVFGWSAAACLLVGLLLGFWLLRTGDKASQTVAKRMVPAEVPVSKSTLEPVTPSLPEPAPATVATRIVEKAVVSAPVPKKVAAPVAPDEIPDITNRVETPDSPREEPLLTTVSPTEKQLPARAPHLLDAALDAHDVVMEKTSENHPARRLPFLLSPNRFPMETAFQTPSSIYQGLRR